MRRVGEDGDSGRVGRGEGERGSGAASPSLTFIAGTASPGDWDVGEGEEEALIVDKEGGAEGTRRLGTRRSEGEVVVGAQRSLRLS